jgi:hypothetical protein
VASRSILLNIKDEPENIVPNAAGKLCLIHWGGNRISLYATGWNPYAGRSKACLGLDTSLQTRDCPDGFAAWLSICRTKKFACEPRLTKSPFGLIAPHWPPCLTGASLLRKGYASSKTAGRENQSATLTHTLEPKIGHSSCIQSAYFTGRRRLTGCVLLPFPVNRRGVLRFAPREGYRLEDLRQYNWRRLEGAAARRMRGATAG